MKFTLKTIHRRYYTPEEVAIHKCADDCWVVVFSRVLDISGLVAQHRGKLTQPLVQHAGEDITHWFNPETREVKTHIDPERNIRLPFLPYGRFLHVPPPEPVTDWNTLELTPWWTDEQYVIGLITAKVRMIQIVNTLTHQSHSIQVCSEETIAEIQKRYVDLQYNAHAGSYTWKYLDGNEFIPLDMDKSLAENGVEDESLEFEKLNLDADDYQPILHIYYNDDLTIL
ncbi:cytochrome b5-like protein [Achlya hypogyna]|uniref:Cytochrome b5 domain-containing protein 1 n=1 Tax=Achlya hypogyna TaxID=1202772 RepID=A0A1V9Z4R5_ACHHY|nr:cytochrome b5-like protein [Achlya hypogyna]